MEDKKEKKEKIDDLDIPVSTDDKLREDGVPEDEIM